MPIEWNADTREFHLRNDLVSYVGRVLENQWLGHVYFGRPLAGGRSYANLAQGEFYGFSNRLGTPQPLEAPTAGSGDFRVPAIGIDLADGSSVLDLRYARHRISPGKPALPGLPATYVEAGGEAETLEIVLDDAIAGIEVTLLYTIYRNRPVIVRSARIANAGASPAVVRCAMSAALDLPDADWQLVQLSGNWARERHVVRTPLRPGRQSVSSNRGSSSHQQNPFVALVRSTTTEEHGEAIGLSLAYSGNFLAEADVDSYSTTRVRIGINPEGFSWQLEPGATFAVPEAILGYSADGLGSLSEGYHRLFRERLARGTWRDRSRPVVLNSWEAAYFSFDQERLEAIASAAADLGVEMFVLDDGWFGQRDDDTTSLGDWQPDPRKLPGGLEPLARRVEAMGLRFGLWIEPEMISRRSRLFEAHPDWAIGIPSRPRTESRSQLVLDMSRPEVVDYLTGTLSEVLGSAPVTYVKWDMNRVMTEPYSTTLPPWRQGEFAHRYMLGLYELYDRITRAFPGILFESCAGGGGRFDPGLLAYAPQGWTSDDTDAIERLRIQYGTSIAYPLSSMAAHVSAVPNHQVGRVTPLSTRAAVAFFGVFGYELDPTALTDEERSEVREQIAFYKRWRELFAMGRFLRLRSPFEGDGNETAWMVVDDDRKTAIVGHYRVLARPSPGPRRLTLRGLDPASTYRVEEWQAGDGRTQTPAVSSMGGDALMNAGLALELTVEPAGMRGPGDFRARIFVLQAE